MAPIALAASLLFAAFLLWKARDGFADVSWATWIPTLWIMRCASRTLTLWLYPRGSLEMEATDSVNEGSVHDQIFFVTLMALALIVLARRVRDWSALIRSNGALALFFLYMLASSVGWSPEPFLSLKRWFRAVGDLFAVLVAGTEPNRRQAVSAILWRCVATLIPLSIVLALYYPVHGVAYDYKFDWVSRGGWLVSDSWIGVTTHKNGLGALAMLAGLLCLWRILVCGGFRVAWRDTRVELPLLLISLWVLLFAGGQRSVSATSVITFVLGAALMVWMRRSAAPRRRVFMALFVVLMGVALVNTFTGTAISSALGGISELSGRDSTLTGRAGIWAALIDLGKAHPILGAGFEGFWSTQATRAFLDRHGLPARLNQAHNGYLEVYLNLGVIGLLLITIVCWRGLKAGLQLSAYDRDFGHLVLVLFAVAMVHNMAEASFSRPTHLIWFTFLLATVRMPSSQTPDRKLSEPDETSRHRKFVSSRHEPLPSGGRGPAPPGAC
jgi:O-antigen ligase